MAILKFLNRKVAAHTLLESLVAMVLIIVSFSLAMLLYLSLMNNQSRSLQMEAALLLSHYVEQTLESNDFFDERMLFNFFVVNRTILPYSGTENIYILKISVHKGDAKLSEHKELIYFP